MIQIRFLTRHLDQLKQHLVRGTGADEEAAWALAGRFEHRDLIGLLVYEVVPVYDQGLLRKGKAGLAIDPDIIAPIVKRARLENATPILCHSHPFSDTLVGFSSIDDGGESELFPKVQARIPNQTVGAMVFGQRSAAARVWLPSAQLGSPVDQIRTLGRALGITQMQLHPGNGAKDTNEEEHFDRQILAFTRKGQELLAKLHVGIVGLGGIGSQVLQMLTYLGVRNFTLIDPDAIESTNLNRLVGTNRNDDIGLKKVQALANNYRRAMPGCSITAVDGNVYDASIASQLKSVDLIFSCTDTMISRMVLTRFPNQYYIPLIDTGINIQVLDGLVTRIGGRVMTILPEDPCLDCLGYLDHEQLERELSDLEQVARPPYVSGIQSPEPAVISYNAVVASLAVNEFLAFLTSGLEPSDQRTYQVYDGVKGIVRRVTLTKQQDCRICSQVLGKGDSSPLPCRTDR